MPKPTSSEQRPNDPAATNREVFDAAAGDRIYADRSLQPAERQALKRLGRDLHGMEMLDIGVGAGRTGYTFAPLVRRYVGVDYSPRMIAASEALLGADENVTLVVGDARDLSMIEGRFDFALFSFNGIDAIDYEDRAKVFAGVKAALRPGGWFLFSTHSIGALPLDEARPPSKAFGGSRLYGLYAAAMGIPYARRIRRINATIDLELARRQGWISIQSMSHDFQVRDVYVDPELQVSQLEALDFRVEAIFDVEGEPVSLPTSSRSPWFDYLCRLPA
ncbi:MAG: class I SAM-dependent methyltransferase [Solirubrobacterales bacterium]